jgi:hypothetical protein
LQNLYRKDKQKDGKLNKHIEVLNKNRKLRNDKLNKSNKHSGEDHR